MQVMAEVFTVVFPEASEKLRLPRAEVALTSVKPGGGQQMFGVRGDSVADSRES